MVYLILSLPLYFSSAIVNIFSPVQYCLSLLINLVNYIRTTFFFWLIRTSLSFLPILFSVFCLFLCLSLLLLVCYSVSLFTTFCHFLYAAFFSRSSDFLMYCLVPPPNFPISVESSYYFHTNSYCSLDDIIPWFSHPPSFPSILIFTFPLNFGLVNVTDMQNKT